MGGSESKEETEEVVRWHDRWDDDAEQRGIAEAVKEFEQRRGSQRMKEVKETYLRIKNDLEEYEVGSKLRLGKFFPADVKEMENINIAMIGPTGSGKSSFINIAEKVMMGEATAITQSTGKEGTIHLEEYLTKFNFRLIDTRGYFELDKGWSEELQKILTGRIRPGMTIERSTDEAAFAPEQHERADDAPLGEQIHGVICVMVDKDPRLKQYRERMKSMKDYLRAKGYSPLAALAFENENDFKDEDKRREIMEELSAAVGSPIDKTFPFINHLASGSDVKKDPESVLNVLDILDTAVTAAEKFIKVRLQREKHSRERQAKGSGPESQSVGDFIQTLGKAHNWDRDRTDALVKQMQDKDIYDVSDLREGLDDISLTIGQKKAIKKALPP
ncbi:PREDICTED: uncharacterized protein LOC109487894 isoform X2 [Branchiostoma belcheri]|uniref:Uncharacterized protein LOC109487894 isoform X2 n=1 Tax=Branchiostoma belcheri TaxID=7741 RepID=A0A6P5AZG0_BRABE|nr:PREDICTED: uncharacterized protein LOC109487894 isoform X2 [Branchiostoma belcheri]